MDINQQIATYFASAGDATGSGEAVPDTTAGNTVVPLIDGRSYFGEIRNLLERLGKGQNVSEQFFYMIGWRNHLSSIPAEATIAGAPPGTTGPSSPTKIPIASMPEFRLEDNKPAPYPIMAELLAQKADAGVDVRVMSWVNAVLAIKFIGEAEPNWTAVVAENLHSVNYLRKLAVKGGQPLAKRICALSVGNMLGAMHLKMVVAFDGSEYLAFTGGIDFVPNRVAKTGHPITTTVQNKNYTPEKPWFEKQIKGTDQWEYQEFWHDMAVSVKGPAVQAFYNFFQKLWNEQLKRQYSLMAVPGRPQIIYLSGQAIHSVEPGTTTVPDRNLALPGTGKHRVQVARTLPQFNFGKTIAPGKNFTMPLSFAPNGVFEVTVARRKAILNAAKYIYIEDPSFWSQEMMLWIRTRVQNNPNLQVLLLTSARGDPGDPPASGEQVEAINNYLLVGMTPQQVSRIKFYVVKPRYYYVHAKVMIIDDYWLFVGSANCTQRSLYTDGELSIAVLDENTNNPLAKQVRVSLWAEHLGLSQATLDNLDTALTHWPEPWPPNPAQKVENVPLPLPAPNKPFNKGRYDYFTDYDSRSKLW
jgi:phosphatidylserine/phosphatidylglycerophosphate/cardiolipin synthase-like enzyme